MTAALQQLRDALASVRAERPAARSAPAAAALAYGTARVAEALEQTADAYADYARSLETQPGSLALGPLEGLLRCARQTGRDRDAAVLLARLRAAAPGRAALALWEARAWRGAGAADRAEPLLRALLAGPLDEDLAFATFEELLRCLLARGRAAAALECCDEHGPRFSDRAALVAQDRVEVLAALDPLELPLAGAERPQ